MRWKNKNIAEPKDEPKTERYRVEWVRYTLTGPDKQAEVLQDTLNAGDAKGWTLKHMMSQEFKGFGVVYVTWDTEG